jgi:hypothetical protein
LSFGLNRLVQEYYAATCMYKHVSLPIVAFNSTKKLIFLGYNAHKSAQLHHFSLISKGANLGCYNIICFFRKQAY